MRKKIMKHKLAFLVLLISLMTAGCTRRSAPNNNGVATLSECEGKGMQFDPNKNMCILPDDAFCYSKLMIKGMSTCLQPASQDDCNQIARNNSNISSLKYRNGSCSKSSDSTPTGKRDTNIKIKVTSRISGAIPKQPNAVALADVAVTPTNNQDTHQLTVMNYPNSGCNVKSHRNQHGTGNFIITGTPSATATSCNAKIVVINLQTGTYNTADIVASVAP